MGVSVPTMRGWPGCASRQMGMRAGFHPLPARVLAMATASGTGFGATLSREVSALEWFGGRVFWIDEEILVESVSDAVVWSFSECFVLAVR